MDFTPITTAITDLAADAVPAISGVIAAVISVIAIKWGFPVVVGFFKKNAK